MRLHELAVFGRLTIMRHLLEIPAHLPVDGCNICFSEPRRGFDQRVEHRLQIERRTAEDLEYIGGRGLLLQ